MSEPRISSPPTIPRSDRFEIVGTLGEGGMGIVYEAIDRELGGRVALKVIRPPEGRAAKARAGRALLRFKREFRLASAIRHPNVVALGELCGGDDGWFFTMERLEGVDFFGWVRPDLPPLVPRDRGRGTRRGLGQEAQPGARVVLSENILVTSTIEGSDVLSARHARLRVAVLQVAQGLAALHAAGLVHRDLKPSNVIVTPTGRAVIVDFGLVLDAMSDGVDESLLESGARQVLGTLEYMSPEQVGGAAPSSASDIYALGVMAYEALTGELPGGGRVADLLTARSAAPSFAPSRRARGVPAELDGLCARMLAREAEDRPSADEIVNALDRRRRRATPVLTSSVRGGVDGVAGRELFVGREVERAALIGALRDSRWATRPIAVSLRGGAGVGKSALVSRACLDALADAPDTWVLRGRCHPAESVPYKAFDGVVDDLAARLVGATAAERSVVFDGADLAMLARTFPGFAVLSHPRAVTADVTGKHSLAPGNDAPLSSGLTSRERLFGTLARIFARVARRHPLLIVLEDVQWADEDSRTLFTALVRQAPTPAPLYVLTERTTAIDGRDTMNGTGTRDHAGVSLDGLDVEQRVIEIDRLVERDARLLAAATLERLGSPRAPHAAAIASAASGHPLFVDLLCRHAPVFAPDAQAPSLRHAILQAVEALPLVERAVIELIAVARARVSLRTLVEALAKPSPDDVEGEVAILSGMAETELASAISSLRESGLVSATGVRSSDTVEPYHEHVATIVRRSLDADRRRDAHLRLARALTVTNDAPAEQIALHWVEAGRPRLAVPYVVRAAAEATTALAFDRAARLYRAALEIARANGNDDQSRELLTHLGDVLAYAGRGAESAGAYLRAAKLTTETPSLELRRRAADQLLRAGHFDEGLALLTEVLGALGQELPSSPR
ncbi:MAG: serine/threonine-protein kinase PknK, partial [Polyangiales bacterium]